MNIEGYKTERVFFVFNIPTEFLQYENFVIQEVNLALYMYNNKNKYKRIT